MGNKILRKKKDFTISNEEVTNEEIKPVILVDINREEVADTDQIQAVSKNVAAMYTENNFNVVNIKKSNKLTKKIKDYTDQHKAAKEEIVKSPLFLLKKPHQILKSLSDVFSVNQTELMNFIVMDWYLENKQAVESTEEYIKYKENQVII
jgi:hypothetical protein